MVDNNISFLDTNLMRLTMELVEWMELEMIELEKTKVEMSILYLSRDYEHPTDACIFLGLVSTRGYHDKIRINAMLLDTCDISRQFDSENKCPW